MSRPFLERNTLIDRLGLLRDEVPHWLSLREIEYAARWAQEHDKDFIDGVAAAMGAVGPESELATSGKRKSPRIPETTLNDIGGYVEAMIRKQKLDKEYWAEHTEDD